ncbi:MAG: hypothetical protein NTY19_22340, partial [Planctomycetota bacterium]|nr:hypothetical protein [Planctomycetota bacterium]
EVPRCSRQWLWGRAGGATAVESQKTVEVLWTDTKPAWSEMLAEKLMAEKCALGHCFLTNFSAVNFSA